MNEQISEIAADYKTIKITKSRIDKGLLAIPVELLDKFPTVKKELTIYFDDDEIPQLKSFTPYDSSSRECRIGGLAHWFNKNQFHDKDSIVIDFIDEKEGIYRLRKESIFVTEIKQIEAKLFEQIDVIQETEEVKEGLRSYSKKTNLSEKEILLNQYIKTRDEPITKRTYKKANVQQRKENVPFLKRKTLEACYEGKCQISGFTFIQRNGKTYFEIHHIDENRGNNWKNLLVVSPNIHARFTYGNSRNEFDNEDWLNRVFFDEQEFQVNQLLNKLKDKKFIKIVYG